MRSNDFAKIMRKLSFPTYIKKGRLAYSLIEHKSGAKLLKGFYLDSCTDKDSFFLQWFVQALYDPFPHLDFSLGDRIGGHLKSTDVDEINKMLASFTEFGNLTHFSDYIPFIDSHPYHGAEIHRLKCYAFYYFFEGDYSKSKSYLLKIIETENSQNIEWVNDVIKMAEEFISLIDTKAFDKGIEKLLQWQRETLSNLKLL